AQLAEITRAVGLGGIVPVEGETPAQALERRVNGFLESVVRGEQQMFSLGALTFTLREKGAGEIFARAVPKVIERVQANRLNMPTPRPSASPPAGQDSGAR